MEVRKRSFSIYIYGAKRGKSKILGDIQVLKQHNNLNLYRDKSECLEQFKQV